MAINYVDFGYWDYGYAENDIKSIQTAEASISGIGLLSATTSCLFRVQAAISGSGFLTARTNATFSAKCLISGNGQVATNLYKMGEEWGITPDQANSWTTIPSNSEGWITQTSGNNQWQRVG